MKSWIGSGGGDDNDEGEERITLRGFHLDFIDLFTPIISVTLGKKRMHCISWVIILRALPSVSKH